LAFPLAIADGDLAIATGDDLVYDAIVQVVLTVPLERSFRPRYGVPDPVFSAAATTGEIAAAYKIAIETQVASVRSADVTATVSDDGQVNVSVTPTIDGRILNAIAFGFSANLTTA